MPRHRPDLNPRTAGFPDACFKVPELGLLEPLSATVYFLLFASYVALQRGWPIDKPWNLANIVTVKLYFTRVLIGLA